MRIPTPRPDTDIADLLRWSLEWNAGSLMQRTLLIQQTETNMRTRDLLWHLSQSSAPRRMEVKVRSSLSVPIAPNAVGLEGDACSLQYPLLTGRLTSSSAGARENKVMKKLALLLHREQGEGRGSVGRWEDARIAALLQKAARTLLAQADIGFPYRSHHYHSTPETPCGQVQSWDLRRSLYESQSKDVAGIGV